MKELINGFSKLSREQKRKLVAEMVSDKKTFLKVLEDQRNAGSPCSGMIDEISENSISHYSLPYSVAPNFLVNGRMYHLPMVTEESSVVAAAAAAAKFWAVRGGFHAKVTGTVKTGQLHFTWSGQEEELYGIFPKLQTFLREKTRHLTEKMESRGGGITGMELLNLSDELPDYYQLRVFFETADSMGANFINTCMEEIGDLTGDFLNEHYPGRSPEYDVIMAILSNYTPDSLVEVWVECHPDQLQPAGVSARGSDFANKFGKAIDIALIDPYRAVTHNKGIFNGIDALLVATGNDFRAVEANGHAYAARDGQYRGLSWVSLSPGRFRFALRLPLSVGSVGGLTRQHPLAEWSFKILGDPGASELMMLSAAAGLANHFSAIKALVTHGIQRGHMKMHLGNILTSLKASPREKDAAVEHFRDRKVSYSDVRNFLENKRTKE